MTDIAAQSGKRRALQITPNRSPDQTPVVNLAELGLTWQAGLQIAGFTQIEGDSEGDSKVRYSTECDWNAYPWVF